MDCSVTPRDERNPFGAVEAAYVDVKGLLMPIQRVPGSSLDRPDRCSVDDVALTEIDRRYYCNNSDVFSPDSIEALDEINSSCYWLLVYNATRSRARGLIVRKIAMDQYQRLGFTEHQVDVSYLQGEECVTRLI